MTRQWPVNKYLSRQLDKVHRWVHALFMPATQTAPTIAAINAFAVATIAVQSCARTIHATYMGKPMEYEAACKVSLDENTLTIRIEQNRVITSAIARDMILAARAAAMEAMQVAGIVAIPQVHKTNPGAAKSAKTCMFTAGLWHMGHHDVTARWVMFRISA